VSHLPAASFPAAVWDGTTANRPQIHDKVAPNKDDFDRIVSELIAVENALGPGAGSELDTRVGALETTVDTAVTGLSAVVAGHSSQIGALPEPAPESDLETRVAALDADLGAIMDRVSDVVTGPILSTDGVMEDLRFPVSTVKVSTDKPPVAGTYRNCDVLDFEDQLEANEQSITFIAQMPHAWKRGTDIIVHIHWVPEDATAGNVYWELSYSWGSINDVFPAARLIYAVGAAPTIVDHHVMTSFAAIDSYGDGTLDMTNANADLIIRAHMANVALYIMDPEENDHVLHFTTDTEAHMIVVYPSTDAGGLITSTAADIVAAINGDPTAASIMTLTAEGTGLGVVNQGSTTVFDKGLSSVILCRLKRKSSNVLDTFTGKDARLLEVDIHYQADKLGDDLPG